MDLKSGRHNRRQYRKQLFAQNAHINSTELRENPIKFYLNKVGTYHQSLKYPCAFNEKDINRQRMCAVPIVLQTEAPIVLIAYATALQHTTVSISSPRLGTAGYYSVLRRTQVHTVLPVCACTATYEYALNSKRMHIIRNGRRRESNTRRPMYTGH
ncbi:hypothetical protein CBL_10750 [Carabus blaptoides fortunei]